MNLPVVWNAHKQGSTQLQKMLVRGTPTALLVKVVNKLSVSKFYFTFQRNGNTHETALALIAELRRRYREGAPVGSYTVMSMNRYDPPPCACGRPGLHIVGSTTYCSLCKHKAVARRVSYAAKRDVNDGLKEQDREEYRKKERSSELHHRALGRARRKQRK